MDSIIFQILEIFAEKEKALGPNSTEFLFLDKEKRVLFLHFLESECGFIKKYPAVKRDAEAKYWLTIKGYQYLKSCKKKIGF